MGSASSKFKKYLQHGDEFAAMQVFQSSGELRKSLDPNVSYGEAHAHNTPLHYAARHGMKHLLRTFVNDMGGNPNKRNALNETALHAACQLPPPAAAKSCGAHERRAACVALLLQWKGVRLANNCSDGQDKGDATREKIDLNAQDQNGNTALHWAASTGLRRCVELLIAQPASALFMENNDKLTPCDLAMKNNHHDIARLLEARMVFADTVGSDTVNEDELAGTGSGDQEEVYSGLRTQDLQEAKDQLLVETSDMLHIPLFTAEALLRDNEWSRETLLEKWMLDPVQCCQLAGVQAPASALQHFNTNFNPAELASSTSSSEGGGAAKDMLCEICLSAISQWDLPTVQMSCKHAFCNQCWEKYLNVKIQEGDAHHILCPAYQCHILVPVELIERLVTPEMARRYLQFDIKAFVETNKSIKWCPVPGCGRAVRLPEQEQYNNDGGPPLPTTSHAVDCGNSHFFCWECLGDAHAPCGCDQWTRWHAKISEIKPEELKTSCSESEDAANCLWLVTNSKPCPNCKSPIQKNEGCNHIKCSKCKFDFCWICQESWKRHSSATGGYFRCNRFEAVHKADEKQGTLITEAVVRNSQMEELSRFLHYYTRFRNHENSQRLEEPLLTGVRQKMELLASSLGLDSAEECGERGGATTKFVEEGVRELLKARRVLCGSYVYGYYLEDNGYNKTIFEFMQNELEEVTEKLSEMIARPYLRTPKPVIVQTTALTRRKRHEFVRAVAKGLVPPETPPGSLQRKQRKRRFPTIMALDQAGDQRTAVGRDVQEALIRELDPNNPWVKDVYGRPGNINSVYDWPAECGGAGDSGGEDDSPASRALAISVLGECRITGCSKPRARNPRTGDLHQYCSLRCSKADQDAYRVAVSSDYNMDLVIALEMSRLQMIEDRMKQVTDIGQGLANVLETLGPSSQGGDPSTSDSCLLDDQLKLAIQLSLQESTAALNKQLQQQAKPVTSTATQAPDESTPDEDGCSCNNKLITECRDCLKHSPVKDVDNAYDDLYEKTSADLTVDYFLKSLANHKIDLKNIDMQGVNLYSPNNELDSNSSTEWNKSTDKDVPCFLKRGKEDGRFQIGDIHETGFINLLTDDGLDDDEDEFYDEQSSIVRSLKRSHSTGDLCARRPTAYRRAACARRLGFSGTVPSTSREPANRYHLDSDHSSNHDEMCEEVVKKMLALPAGKRHQLLHQQAALSPSDDPTLYQGQSSLEDTTTTSDSLNADMEVCGILDHSDEIMPNYTTDGDEITLVVDEQNTVEQNTVEQNTVPEKEHLSVDCTTNSMGTFKLTTYKKSPKLLRNLKTRGAQHTTSSSSGEWGRSTTKSPPPAEEKRRSEATSETPSSGGSSKILINPLACLKAKLCSAHLPKANARSKIAINRSIGLLRDSKKHKQQYAGSYSSSDTPAKQCDVYDKSTKQPKVYSKCDNSDNKNQTVYLSDSNKQKNKKQEKHVIVYTGSDNSTGNKQCSVYSTCDNSTEYNNSDKKQCIYDNSNYEKPSKNLQKAKQQVYSETKMCAMQKSIVKSAKVVPEPGLYIDKHVTIDKHLTIDTRKMSLASNKDNGGIESLQESHRKAFKLSGGKTVSQNLRIRICKSPTAQNKLQATSQLQVETSEPKQLETDSSNEYESETGIPKSPTLYISGVSISRTPEPPKSPGTGLVALAAALSGRQTRSSSLTVPAGTVATQTNNGNGGGGLVMTDALRVSNSSLNVPGSPEPYTPSLTRSMTPVNRSKTPSPQKSPVLLLGKENCPSGGTNNNKSKSASEPEREREMFRFPKSSTDGALSSVLHVQESNLSSDDFHEALFLLERSPKTRDSKRRKKAKKKDKDNNNIGDCCGGGRTEEASSIL